jgi:outer membrane protein
MKGIGTSTGKKTWPVTILVILACWAAGLCAPQAVSAGGDPSPSAYNLPSVIAFALTNNPKLKISERDVETEVYGIKSARGERMPRVDFASSVTRFRYPMPVGSFAITGPIGPSIDLPEVNRTIYDTGGLFRLPLFRGGRLYRGVLVAETKKALAEDNYRVSKQELIYNLSSVYYKIGQLEKLLAANDASVKQLEEHKRNVELFLKAGTAPRLDLLKTEVELSHAEENRLLVKNNVESTYELLKVLMGVGDMAQRISLVFDETPVVALPPLESGVDLAFSRRPEYMAVMKKVKIQEERVKIARGKRLPDVYAAGQYGGKAGDNLSFRENWNIGVGMTFPVFDGGLIGFEVDKERNELAKAKEEERSLRLSITREVRDAYLSMANASERIDVTGKAIESARENLRVELLKYETGAGTSTDVIDARTALLRAETDHYQALYDKATASAYAQKAIGEEAYPVDQPRLQGGLP